VKQLDHEILSKGKSSLEKRLERKTYEDQPKPMLQASNIVYEMSERVQAIGYGGVGAMHTLACRLKLDRSINERVKLLKFHVPYFESDHVLNMAYNVLTGGRCLEDIERLRNDETYMNGLAAERIPDPTTAGDFLRRFDEGTLLGLQEAINDIRRKIWAKQGRSFRREAIIDADGTIAPTTGGCKGGMDIAYNGDWGYAPLILTLANTNEVLYVVNRSGNRTSSDGAAPWMDRAIAQVEGVFKEVWIRGDTDFSLTKNFDRWDERVQFLFGYDAHRNLIRRAEELPQSAWKGLERPVRYRVKGRTRRRPERIKERIIREREYENIRLCSEDVAEFDYRPTQCRNTYRMVVVRKNLSVEKGEKALFDDIRYFFYITNNRSKSKREIVVLANGRCNQENVIGQLKSGVHALRMPSSDLLSNWAYMVIAALAWNLKAWYGLMVQAQSKRKEILGMEFKRFLLSYVQIPCQVLNTGRRLVYRIFSYSEHLATFLETFAYIQRLKFT
jgi:hypothetical protein